MKLSNELQNKESRQALEDKYGSNMCRLFDQVGDDECKLGDDDAAARAYPEDLTRAVYEYATDNVAVLRVRDQRGRLEAIESRNPAANSFSAP